MPANGGTANKVIDGIDSAISHMVDGDDEMEMVGNLFAGCVLYLDYGNDDSDEGNR